MELKIYHISVITFDGSSNGGGGGILDSEIRNQVLGLKWGLRGRTILEEK